MTVYPSPLEGALFPSWSGNVLPQQRSEVAALQFLGNAGTGDAATVAKNYLQQNASTFKLTAADLANTIVTNNYVDQTTGNRHIYFQQTFNGLPIADAHANVSLTSDGKVIAANVSFVQGLNYLPGGTPPTPAITAQQAVDIFAAEARINNTTPGNVTDTLPGSSQQTTINDPDISINPIIAKLQYVPAPGGGIELGWQIIARPPAMAHWFDVAVAAAGDRTGQITRVADWVADATYTVFEPPVTDPSLGSRTTLFDPHDTLASPFGWHDTNLLPGSDTTDTSGNNVIAQTPGPLPQTAVSPILDFTFPLDVNLDASLNQDAQLTNLFYYANLAHDVAYRHGFHEAAGNFQFTNRSGVGIPGDPVIALDQATFALGIPVLNNAFMATPPDGQSPTMAMGLFDINLPANFFRSSSLDGMIVLHEYTHGISNRLTGGPANVNALQAIQSGGMGEGWSDWFALINTISPGDNQNTPRVLSNWILNQPNNLGGIRRFPYSFDKSINPLTLGRYNGDIFPNQNNSEVHNSGEIWASALWDMTWMLINKYGYSDDLYTGNGGNNIAIRLVFEAMKIQPTNPDFLEARDAIIAADFALNAGNNYELIWSAFARRGFGVSATTPSANSLLVVEAFDTPLPLGRVQGTVFNDLDGDGKRDNNEPPLAGVTVYHDANQNARRDAGERTFVTGPSGVYSFAFVTSQLVHIRQDLSNDFKQTLPANNAGRVVFVNQSQIVTGQNFGNQAKPGRIAGFKFNDLNANGAFDDGEPPMAGVVVYVDMNNDSKVSIIEPSAVTDNFGKYVIKDVPPGNWTVREVLSPGMQQTVPGPLADVPYAHSNVTVNANRTTFNVNFANTIAQDFGDAPASYRTRLAANGPRHGILPGFHLGTSIDAEPDGLPTPNATGDDASPLPPDPLPPDPLPNPDDENGIVFVNGGISPGTTAIIQVTISTGPSSPGRLHGWVDFDQDGTFESNERVVANMLLGAGTRNVSFQVPANAATGTTFARFRYGYESDLGPTGPSVAGEVEDYQVIVLPGTPVANPDVFSAKQNAEDFELNVLANDPPTIFGPVTIVPDSIVLLTEDKGSTFEVNAARDRIVYTAGPGLLPGEQEVFTYRVTDGQAVSEPGRVTINITLADPIALDDTFTESPNDLTGVSVRRNLMANDVFPVTTRIIAVAPLSDPRGTTLTIDGQDQSFVNFTAPPGFRGSVQYVYTIDDENDVTTAPGSGIVTFQVIEPAPTDEQLDAAGYLAVLSVILIDPLTNQPSASGDLTLNQGETFEVLITARDLRQGVLDENMGVQAAYLDLLFDRTKVTPISITYDPDYNELRRGQLNEPATGQINEAGATDTIGAPPGPGEQDVFRVLLRAIGPTGGNPIQIIGDPADENETVLSAAIPGDPVEGNPVVLADTEVFHRPSGNITIFGAGEGLFVNRENPLDTNQDAKISAMDVLTVVNTLNLTGPRSLVGQSISSSGAMSGKIDANMDSRLTAMDALVVINYLNARSHTIVAQMAAEGEGQPSAGTTDASLMGMMSLDHGDQTSSDPAAGGTATPLLQDGQMSALDPLAASTSSAASTSEPAKTTATVDPAAADDLFAELAASRAELKRRYFNR